VANPAIIFILATSTFILAPSTFILAASLIFAASISILSASASILCKLLENAVFYHVFSCSLGVHNLRNSVRSNGHLDVVNMELPR